MATQYCASVATASPASHASEQYGDVDLFIQLDRVGAAVSVVFVACVNGLFLREPGVWLIMPFLLGLIVALSAAGRAIRRGQLTRSLALIAGGNWLIAIAVPVLLPFLWPIMILTVMLPLVLASPHLSRRQIVAAIVGAALTAALVATIGLLNDDGGVIDDIDDAAELVIVIGSLSAQIVPIGLVVWQHNELQRSNVGSLQVLNSDLMASEAALAQSRDRVVQAADTERRRIERDLHDGAQQRLVALGVRLRLLQSQVHEDPAVNEGVAVLIDELDAAIEEVRELAHGIYPPLLQTRGLPDALSAVARRSGLELQTDVADVGRWPEPVETALYFIALEALSNATKHAPDSSVSLSLRQDADDLVLQVADDGPGFNVERANTSQGFDNIRDRLAVVGGALDLDSAPGRGTTLTATVPLDTPMRSAQTRML